MSKFTREFDDRGERTGPRGAELARASSLQCNSTEREGRADLAWLVKSDRHRFAAKVRAGRAVLGWSQSDLGRRAGLSQRSIYRLELAAVDVRRSTVVALEATFRDAGIEFEQFPDGGFRIVVAGSHSVRQ